MQWLALAVGLPLSDSAGGDRPGDPGLGHRPRARAGLAPRRADRGRGGDRDHARGVPGPDRPARFAARGDQRQLRVLGGTGGWSPDPGRRRVAIAGERPAAKAARRALNGEPGRWPRRRALVWAFVLTETWRWSSSG